MNLKAPSVGVRPKRLSNLNRAFTGKPAVKIKRFKPEGDADNGSDNVPKDAQTGALAVWLKDHGDRDGYSEVRQYLLAGPPYKGDAAYEAKEQLKDHGARWVPNPLKQKGMNRSRRTCIPAHFEAF